MPNEHAKVVTADINDRPYAKLSELKVEDTIEIDDGFSCLEANSIHRIKGQLGHFYIDCNEGRHELANQADDGEHLIGIYKV